VVLEQYLGLVGDLGDSKRQEDRRGCGAAIAQVAR
jgi:hypothetical protein